MTDYKKLREEKKKENFLLAEKILNDNTVDPYERFDLIEGLYPVGSWIVYPFGELVKEALKDIYPNVNLNSLRLDYDYCGYAERHENIMFSSIVEGFMDKFGTVFDPECKREMSEFTEEELNSPVVELFKHKGVSYKFSFNELINTLKDFAIETKTSGFQYDW